MKEIHDRDEFSAYLATGRSLTGLRLQALDLTPFVDDLLTRSDFRRSAVLGGVVPEPLAAHLRAHGAVLFPEDPNLPVEPYRSRLYTPDELYAGLMAHGYDATPDFRAYRWHQDGRKSRDALVTMIRAIHDDSITDALAEGLSGCDAVGVMGGHALSRGSEEYADAVRLGWALARAGRVVLTGGGPGAMEAANLGGFVAGHGGDQAQLRRVVERLDGSRSSPASIEEWAKLAFDVRGWILAEGSARSLSSIGIPTWFYGHEPPNVFCDGIAKYFSNAVREDGLLARSNAGIVVLPGAAGTVQEIFQAVTPRYYAGEDEPVPPLVLVDVDYWTRTVPVWPALEALAADRHMVTALHLVDSTEAALELV